LLWFTLSGYFSSHHYSRSSILIFYHSLSFFLFLILNHLVQPVGIQTPCDPSPCGFNAICKEYNGAGSCTCKPDYFGDPYVGCKPECVGNSECPSHQACINNKCGNPCPGPCGVNAECRVHNHYTVCLCMEGFEGDPLKKCIQREMGMYFLLFKVILLV
jgi:hypothetical protein